MGHRPAAGRAPAQRRDVHWEKSLDEFPWLAPLDSSEAWVNTSGGPKRKRTSASSDDMDDNEEDVIATVVDEETEFAAIKAVERARSALAAGDVSSHEDFKPRVLQQCSNLARLGQRHDAIQGYASSLLVIDLCDRRGVHNSMRFPIQAKGIGEFSGRIQGGNPPPNPFPIPSGRVGRNKVSLTMVVNCDGNRQGRGVPGCARTSELKRMVAML